MATNKKAQMLLNSIRQKYPDFPEDGLYQSRVTLGIERVLFAQNPVAASKYSTEIDNLNQGI